MSENIHIMVDLCFCKGLLGSERIAQSEISSQYIVSFANRTNSDFDYSSGILRKQIYQFDFSTSMVFLCFPDNWNEIGATNILISKTQPFSRSWTNFWCQRHHLYLTSLLWILAIESNYQLRNLFLFSNSNWSSCHSVSQNLT